MKQKTVEKLEIGDQIILENGDKKTITDISNGMYKNSRLIEWRRGWTCRLNNQQVYVV